MNQAGYRKHRHFYRLRRSWNHPRGYLFHCQRCENEGLSPYAFARRDDFWAGGVA